MNDKVLNQNFDNEEKRIDLIAVWVTELTKFENQWDIW